MSGQRFSERLVSLVEKPTRCRCVGAPIPLQRVGTRGPGATQPMLIGPELLDDLRSSAIEYLVAECSSLRPQRQRVGGEPAEDSHGDGNRPLGDVEPRGWRS